MKCDVRKFFASIDHNILLAVLAKCLPDTRTLALLREVIGSFKTPGRPASSPPLGNLTSQLLANVYLNELDQLMKHRLKAHYYVRYADDFVVLSQNRAWLVSLIPRIGSFLHERLALELHPRKVSIATLASGIDFLGWVHFSDHRVLRTSTKRRMLRNLAAKATPARITSYRGMLSHGNAYRLAGRIPEPGER